MLRGRNRVSYDRNLLLSVGPLLAAQALNVQGFSTSAAALTLRRRPSSAAAGHKFGCGSGARGAAAPASSVLGAGSLDLDIPLGASPVSDCRDSVASLPASELRLAMGSAREHCGPLGPCRRRTSAEQLKWNFCADDRTVATSSLSSHSRGAIAAARPLTASDRPSTTDVAATAHLPLHVGSNFSGSDVPVQSLASLEIAFRHRLVAESNRVAQLSLRLNGAPDTLLGDAAASDHASPPPTDIFTAGFPFQRFSGAGHREGVNDRHCRGRLVD